MSVLESLTFFRDEVREMMNKKQQGSSTLAKFEEEMNEVSILFVCHSFL